MVIWESTVCVYSSTSILSWIEAWLGSLKVGQIVCRPVFDACLQIRSETIATYALCGFANFGSLGIVIGGLSKWKGHSSTPDATSASPSCSVMLCLTMAPQQ